MSSVENGFASVCFFGELNYTISIITVWSPGGAIVDTPSRQGEDSALVATTPRAHYAKGAIGTALRAFGTKACLTCILNEPCDEGVEGCSNT